MTLPLALIVVLSAQASGQASAANPAAPAVPRQTAVVVVGDGLSTHELGAAEQGLRSAAEGWTLQDGATTAQRLDAASARGFSCALRNIDCLVQVGVICGVEQVLLVDMSHEGGGKTSLVLVDVDEGKATRAASVAGKDPSVAIAALADPRAMAAAVALTPAPASRATAPPPAVPAPAVPPVVTPAAEPASIMPTVGIVGGGVLVALGAVTTGIGSLDYLTAADAEHQLGILEAQAQDKAADPTYLDHVRAERRRFDDANAGWVAVGQPLVAAGAAVIGIGLGAVVLSSLWMASE